MAAKKMTERLKNMKMPKRPMAEEDADMDLASELSEDEMLEDEMADEEMVESADEEMLAELEMYSDDDLIAEMQRRGLMDDEMADEDIDDEDVADEAVV